MRAILCLIFVVVSSVSPAKLGDITVITTEMVNTMENFAVGQTLVLSAKEKDYNQITQKLVSLMDQEYGKGWLALFVANVTTTIPGINFSKNTTLVMGYQQYNLFLGKQEIAKVDITSRSSFETVLAQSQTSEVLPIQSFFNETVTTWIHTAAKEVVNIRGNNGYWSCYEDRDKYNSAGCYRMVSLNMEDKLRSHPLFTKLKFSVTVGRNHLCYSYGQQTDKTILFTLGQMIFQVHAFD